jgi:hypothetical protein
VLYWSKMRGECVERRELPSIGLGAELDRPLYAAELFRGWFRRGGDASGIAPFRWEEISAVLTLTVRGRNTSEL